MNEIYPLPNHSFNRDIYALVVLVKTALMANFLLNPAHQSRTKTYQELARTVPQTVGGSRGHDRVQDTLQACWTGHQLRN